MVKSVLAKIEEKAFGKMGYYTVSDGYKYFIEKAGRVGNGTRPNPSTYNHAQSFLVRACAISGNSQMAYKATRYILPFEEEYAPVEQTFAPPYAIANGYSCNQASLHRVELQFLSGTVSYVLRNFYNFFFGIEYDLEGLKITPSIPKEFGKCTVEFTYLDKKFTINYTPNSQNSNQAVVNGKKIKLNTVNTFNIKSLFIPDNEMLDFNNIEINY